MKFYKKINISDDEKIPIVSYFLIVLLYFIVTMAFFSLNQLRDVPRDNVEAIKFALIGASVPTFLGPAIALFARYKRKKKREEEIEERKV